MQTRKQDILYYVATVAWTAPCCNWQGMVLKIDYPQKYAQMSWRGDGHLYNGAKIDIVSK